MKARPFGKAHPAIVRLWQQRQWLKRLLEWQAHWLSRPAIPLPPAGAEALRQRLADLGAVEHHCWQSDVYYYSWGDTVLATCRGEDPVGPYLRGALAALGATLEEEARRDVLPKP